VRIPASAARLPAPTGRYAHMPADPSTPAMETEMRAMTMFAALAASTLTPGVAHASNFSILMWLLLVPYAILALIVWAITWLTTVDLQVPWLKVVIRTLGLCLIFTPTFTAGGNGQMLSVALYDIVMAGLGGDPVYARQALVNAGIATVVVSALVMAALHVRKRSGASSVARNND
jgi:hypothetical protein